jgi:hypothetical protein
MVVKLRPRWSKLFWSMEFGMLSTNSLFTFCFRHLEFPRDPDQQPTTILRGEDLLWVWPGDHKSIFGFIGHSDLNGHSRRADEMPFEPRDERSNFTVIF